MDEYSTMLWVRPSQMSIIIGYMRKVLFITRRLSRHRAGTPGLVLSHGAAGLRLMPLLRPKLP
jgi:hypothetical protein